MDVRDRILEIMSEIYSDKYDAQIRFYRKPKDAEQNREAI